MANITELLNKLKNPENLFQNKYNIFMKKCLASNSIDDMEDSNEVKDLIVTLQKHNYVMPSFIKKLVEYNSSPHFHECNLFIYESFYHDNDETLLSYADISNNEALKETYLSNSADIAAFSIATAQNWIMHYCD